MKGFFCNAKRCVLPRFWVNFLLFLLLLIIYTPAIKSYLSPPHHHSICKIYTPEWIWWILNRRKKRCSTKVGKVEKIWIRFFVYFMRLWFLHLFFFKKVNFSHFLWNLQIFHKDKSDTHVHTISWLLHVYTILCTAEPVLRSSGYAAEEQAGQLCQLPRHLP